MNKYDWKYIFKKVLIFFIIFVILSFVRSCKVSAATFDVSANTTIAGYNIPDWWDMYNNGRTLLVRYNDLQYYSQMAETGYASYGYFYVCSTRNFSVNNNTADCSDGCYQNEFQVVNLGGSCNIINDTGEFYFIFYSVKKWGWYNADTTPYVRDNLTFTGIGGTSRVYFISNNLSDENLFINYAGTQKLQELQQQTINQINSSTNSIINNQNSNTQSIINNQNSNQAQNHQDSINEQNAINSNTNAINNQTSTITDDNVSGAESKVNELLNNSAFQDNSGIQSIITAPLNFIQGLTNSCSPISLTIPFINTNVNIPCMKQELTNRVPTLVPILSTIINGFVIYRILLDIVAIVKSAREPDEDRIEVLDL